MDKRTLLIILVGGGLILFFLVILLLLMGKGSSGRGKTTLIYWGLWEEEAVFLPLIEEYQKLNPAVEIKYIKKTFGHIGQDYNYLGNYQSAVEERISRTGGIDIVRVHASWIPKYVKYLTTAPTSLINGNEVRRNYYPAISESILSTSGNVYAIPLYIDGLVLFYNKDLFAQAGITSPPTNWDKVIEYGAKLTKRDINGDVIQGGIGLGAGSNITHSTDILMLMFTQGNVKVIDLANRKVDIASQNGIDAVNYYLDFTRKHKVWSHRLPNDFSSFVQGKLAMFIAPSWRAFDIINQNSRINFDMAPVPILPGANPDTPQYLANFYVEVVPKNSPNSAEAWKFLTWLSKPEQLRKLYQNETQGIAGRIFGEAYPRVDMAGELRDAPYVKAVIEMAPNMKAWPIIDIGIWEQNFKQFLTQLETGTGGGVQVNLQSLNATLNNLIFNSTR